MRVEKIVYYEAVTESDGAGGTTGSLESVYTCLAEWEAIKETKTLEANQTSLRQGYRFVQWIDSAFEPKNGSIIKFLDEWLTIQSYRYYDEAMTRYSIVALEQAPNGLS